MGSNKAVVLSCLPVRRGFNPCFNGSWVQILMSMKKEQRRYSFNPCFNGSWVQIH
ncbi:hypothetical protein MCHI_000474 [Candidatus Magnetoovum chiemensis]|nr:hypothetical protein MCHI_000474 [Candidatus Magnetoovum chiemensis]